MDIKKLEKLSCLKIDTDQKEAILSSIEGVIYMLKEIDSLKVSEIVSNKVQLTVFRKDLQVQENSKTGLHLEEGYFLAPKVIIRD